MTNLTVVHTQEVLGKEFTIYGTKEDPMFLAKDVSEWIENKNTSQMLNVVDEEEKGLYNVYTLGGVQQSWFLTEDGVYEVLMQSRKPVAKAFKKEVKKILKEIRLNGGYISVSQEDSDEDLMARALIVAQRAIARKEQQLLEATNKIEEDAPKVEYFDKVLDSNDTYLISQIAQELNVSAIKLNEFLRFRKVQYKRGSNWYLYQNYRGFGFTDSKTNIVDTPFGERVNIQLRWTNKGRELIHRLYWENENIQDELPLH